MKEKIGEKRMKKLVLGISLAIVGSVWFGNASAVPSFAAAHDKKCSYCHTAWPQLNEKGRKFKENGYRLPEDLKGKNDAFTFESGSFPISGMLVSRPYDREGNKKVRAIHEAEVFVAGALNKKYSGFFEIEAEDETGFDPEFGNIVLSYRHNEAVNLQAAWANALWTDSYGFYGDHFRMTRGHVKTVDAGFGGLDGNLRSNRQQMTVTGRPMKDLFYSVGYGGIAGEVEGDNANVVSARLAYDISKNMMAGLMNLSGKVVATDTTPSQKFNRVGLDFQGDFGATRVQAAHISATDDAATGSVKNKATSVQGMYVMKTKSGKPTFVPVARYDMYEEADGADKFGELTLNLTYYFAQNVKGYVEYWKQTKTPDSVDAENRLTFQVYVGL